MKPNYQEILKSELKKSLPGKLAHIKMMPEGREIVDNPPYQKDAAVVVLIFKSNAGQDEIVFIKRNEYDGYHSGQVSFPGGKKDPEDKNILATAIRECYEEIGVKLSEHLLIGSLSPLYVIVSKFMIYPFVFYLDNEPIFNSDKSEVNYIIRFPVNELLLSNLRKEKEMFLFDNNYLVPYYDIKNEIVWGATAMILSEFIEILQLY
jgi:8-oxo-dGTP pyrophosphatase MutT (NUDIX family)